jgi:hypothetical protein
MKEIEMTATKTKKAGSSKKGSAKGKAAGKKAKKKAATAPATMKLATTVTEKALAAVGEPAEAGGATLEAPAKTTGPVADNKPKPKQPKTKKLSAIDAAAKVLAEAKAPMSCKELIAAMAEQGLWTSPGGATPWATLYSALTREITQKGKDARFQKTDRGRFAIQA